MRKNIFKFISIGLLFLAITVNAQIPKYIPKDSLIGWWPFNGNANDESGNGNHGIVSGTTLSKDRKGVSNKSYSFNGSGNYITISKSGLARIQQNITISVWIYMDGGSCNPRILECNGFTLITNGTSNTSRTVVGAFGNGSNRVGGTSSKSVNSLSWHHLVFVGNGSSGTAQFYFDGASQGNLTSWTSLFNKINYTTDLTIGNIDPYRCDWWGGKIDDLVIWNRALDSNEIKALYFGCKPKNHKKLTTADTLTACSSLKLTSKNKNYKSYKWNTGDTTLSTTITKSGLITILETDSNGCKNIDTVYVRILKDEISVAPDTSICNVKANDTLKLNLVKWFGKSDYDYFNSSKNKVQTADIFIKNSSTKIWKGSAALKNNNALKCPISGKVYPSVVYPRLVNKLTDTVLTTTTSLKPALADKKYTKYRWSNGDSIFTTKYINSGNYWFQQTDSVGCFQTDSFHFSRINLIIPSRITAKLGVKMMLKVKDSTNASSFVVWSNADTGWSTGYKVTKNVDTLYATQTDAYRSVTKFIVITKAGPKSLAQNQDFNFEYDTTNQDNDIPPKQAIETSNIRIYPNPVGSTITLEGLTSTHLKYEIYSVSGKLVQVGKASPTINVENLSTGLYLLKLENVAVKFVKE